MFVYFIINEVNLKMYVGKSNNPDVRWKEHLRDSRSSPYALYRAMRKYSLDKFHMVVWISCVSESEAYLHEKKLVSEFKTLVTDNGYNMTLGGDGVPHTPEMIEHQKHIQKIVQNTPEAKRKRSQLSKAAMQIPGARENAAQKTKDWFQQPGNREKHSVSQRICKNKPESRLNASLKTKAFLADPVNLERHRQNIIKYYRDTEDQRPKRKRTPRPNRWDKLQSIRQEIVRLYVDEGRRVYEIVKVIGKSRSSVRNILRKEGVYPSKRKIK